MLWNRRMEFSKLTATPKLESLPPTLHELTRSCTGVEYQTGTFPNNIKEVESSKVTTNVGHT